MWRKPGPSGVIRSMLQPGMGQSSFMPCPMGLRPPPPNTTIHAKRGRAKLTGSVQIVSVRRGTVLVRANVTRFGERYPDRAGQAFFLPVELDPAAVLVCQRPLQQR